MAFGVPYLQGGSVTGWYWSSGQAARGLSIDMINGIYVPDWRNATFWPFFSPPQGNLYASGGNALLNLGIVATAPASGSAVWALGWSGNLWNVASGGAVLQTALPSGIYAGVATSISSDAPAGYTALGGTWDASTIGTGLTASSGNLLITKTASGTIWVTARSTAPLTGKCYWKTRQTVVGHIQSGFVAGFGPSGIALTGTSSTGFVGYASGLGISNALGPNPLYRNGVTSGYPNLTDTTLYPGDVEWALDVPNSLLYLRAYASGGPAWYGADGIAGHADPVAGTGGLSVSGVLTGNDRAMISLYYQSDAASGTFSFPTTTLGPYSITAASGAIYDSGGTLLGTFAKAAYGLAGSSSTFYTLLPSVPAVGTMSSGGVSGSIALPSGIAYPSVLLVSGGSPLVAGGWADAPLFSGVAAFGLDPATLTQVLGVGSGTAVLWGTAASGTDAWTFSQAVTGNATNLTSMCWAAAGTQALASDPVSGVVQVFGYAANVLSRSQTLTLSGAGQLTVLPSSVDALVCRTAQNEVRPLTASGGVWSASGAGLTLSGAAVVVSTGSGLAAVGYASGVALLTQTAGVWAVTATGALGFAPSLAAVDAQGNLYFAGASGYAVVSGTSVLASGTFASGTPTGMAIDQGRWIFAVPAVSGLLVYGQSSPSAWSQMASAVSVSGTPAGICIAGTTLFTGSVAGGTRLFCLSGSPYLPQRVESGAVSIYAGSGTWYTAALGIGQQPSAAIFDASGNVFAVCTNNNYFTISPTGVTLASGTIFPFAAQTQSTPMGLSSLLFSGPALYASTSMAGDLVQIQ